MKYCWIVLFSLYNISSVIGQKFPFSEENHPKKPDYHLEQSWSALPFRKDAADIVPFGEIPSRDSLKRVDVFYIHPTIYMRGPLWNASLGMKKVNRRVDRYPVRLQASVFNRSCRIYAPRYRQAVVKVFYEQTPDGQKALDLAYEDVKRAFNHYLKEYNNGRPFIIAGHSQGTYHARRLVSEMVDATSLNELMIAAYLIGFNVNDSMYSNLKICSSPDQTGCYVTWMSYGEGYQPSSFWHLNTDCVNPLTWTLDTSTVALESYDGTVVLNPSRILKRQISARITNIGGKVLYVKTKAPWFRHWKNLHVADYGLFYGSIRENVANRIASYFNSE